MERPRRAQAFELAKDGSGVELQRDAVERVRDVTGKHLAQGIRRHPAKQAMNPDGKQTPPENQPPLLERLAGCGVMVGQTAEGWPGGDHTDGNQYARYEKE